MLFVLKFQNVDAKSWSYDIWKKLCWRRLITHHDLEHTN